MHTLPKPSVRWGLLVGLCWLYTSIHLDRQILAILAESVKSDLHLSDQSLGALTGSDFSIVYALLGLYFGQRADRDDRLSLVKLGAWIWSFSSIGAAFAGSYALLVVGRAGLAAGEAIATAAAVSLMAELSGDRYRARASSVFFAGAFLGAGLAAALGGATVEYFQRSHSIAGWRAALVLAGLPGIAGALYLSCFNWREPARPRSGGMGGAAVTLSLIGASMLSVLVQTYWSPTVGVPLALSLATGAACLWARGLRLGDAPAFQATWGNAAFRWFLLAFAALLFVDSAASFWLIPFAERRFAVGAATAGAQLGALLIVGGIAGAVLGGLIADRWYAFSAAGRIWTALIAALLETAAILTAIFQVRYPAFLLAYGCFCLAGGAWIGVAAAIGMDIVPRAHRGVAIGGYFLVTTVLGPGLGAWVAGMLADSFGSLSGALIACCLASIVATVAFARLGVISVGGRRAA